VFSDEFDWLEVPELAGLSAPQMAEKQQGF
jgi:hypothetical protein